MNEQLDAATRLLMELVESFKESIANMPPPPPGWYYAPGEIKDIRHDGDKYVIDATIELKPIIE